MLTSIFLRGRFRELVKDMEVPLVGDLADYSRLLE